MLQTTLPNHNADGRYQFIIKMRCPVPIAATICIPHRCHCDIVIGLRVLMVYVNTPRGSFGSH